MEVVNRLPAGFDDSTLLVSGTSFEIADTLVTAAAEKAAALEEWAPRLIGITPISDNRSVVQLDLRSEPQALNLFISQLLAVASEIPASGTFDVAPHVGAGVGDIIEPDQRYATLIAFPPHERLGGRSVPITPPDWTTRACETMFDADSPGWAAAGSHLFVPVPSSQVATWQFNAAVGDRGATTTMLAPTSSIPGFGVCNRRGTLLLDCQVPIAANPKAAVELLVAVWQTLDPTPVSAAIVFDDLVPGDPRLHPGWGADAPGQGIASWFSDQGVFAVGPVVWPPRHQTDEIVRGASADRRTRIRRSGDAVLIEDPKTWAAAPADTHRRAVEMLQAWLMRRP